MLFLSILIQNYLTLSFLNELALLIPPSVKNTRRCVKQSLEAYYIHQWCCHINKI